MHIILEIPPQIKIWGFKSISHFLLISLSLNRSLSQARESFVVWGGGTHLAGTTVYLDLFLCVVLMMSKTSSVLPHNPFTRPDPPPPYFYLWGYLKDNVYENNPQTIGELKAAITAKIREIP
jgi:hypothetical protein